MSGLKWVTGDIITFARMNQKTLIVQSAQPAIMYPGMMWNDIDDDTLYQRNAANDAWIERPGVSLTATISGLWTFDRGAAAPFAVDAASLVVANLDVDKVDGLDLPGTIVDVLSDPIQVYDPSGGDTIHSHDAEVTEDSTVYVKKKAIEVDWLLGHENVKVDFDLKSGEVGALVYGRLYVNDVAVGTEQSDSTGGYVPKSEILADIADLDEIQLYLKSVANLISLDTGSLSIYIHSGVTSTVSTSFSSLGADPRGLTYDGVNLISCDTTTDSIYIHSGVTSTVSTSFSSPNGEVRALTYDGVNLISCDAGTDSIHIHAGVTSTVSTSFSTPFGDPLGLTYDGVNLISCDATTDSIYIHAGITSTVSTSFSSPNGDPSGLTYDGVNLISLDLIEDSIYIHAGITSTVSTSFSSPNGDPLGATYACVTAYARNLRIIGEWKTLSDEVSTFTNTL